MIMGTLLVLLLVVVGGWVAWKLWKKPDANNDGVIDHKDVVHTVGEVASEAKAEAVEAAGKVVEKVKKARAKKAK
jgi:predicted negative regulator of RcsB-dependent stress response